MPLYIIAMVLAHISHIVPTPILELILKYPIIHFNERTKIPLGIDLIMDWSMQLQVWTFDKLQEEFQ